MSISLVLMKDDYCASCLQQSDFFGKRLQNYVFSDDRIAYALQETNLTLCTFCKRKAAQAEHFLSSIWNNQKLWSENDYTTHELLLEEKRHLPAFYNLTLTKPVSVDINHDVKTKSLTKFSPNEIVSNITYEPLPSVSPVASPSNVAPPPPMPLGGCSAKVEQSVKVEVSIEEDEGHDGGDWNCLDDVDETPQYEVAIADENNDNKKHMEAFKAAMEKYKSKVNSDTTVRTVPDRICKPRPLRGKKKAKDNVVLVNISRDECMAERATMATDPKYIESPFKCDNCIKGFVNKYAYENHMEKHSVTNGRYECDICFQRADSEDKMYVHKKYHFVRYKCPECGIMRICRSTIQDHYLSNHCQERQEIKCPHCPRTFRRMVTRKKHIMYNHRGRTRVHCQFCTKTYANQEGLLSHCVNVHPQESELTQRRPYACKHCDKTFTAPSHLKKHEYKHTNKKEFYCVECDKSFKSESNLKHHLKIATPHVNYLELPFPCVRCDKRFSVRRDLEFHMNGTHLKIKPYQCDQCERAYPSKCSLRKHIQVVHVGIPKPKHPCSMCGKEFDNIKNHMRTHTGERPFECSQCPMKFSQSSILNTHIRLIHLKLTRKGLKRPEK